MDPFSIATGVAGLIALVGSIVPLVTAAHGAREETEGFINELHLLQSNLKRLETFLRSLDPKSTSFQHSSLLVAQTNSLDQNLAGLKHRLERTSASTARQIIWPLRQKGFQQYVDHFRAFGQLMQFALTIDTSELLSNTSNGISAKLAQHIQELKVLDEVSVQIAALNHSVGHQTALLEDMRQDDERTALLDWLSDDSQHRHHDSIRTRRAHGTGGWILDTPEFVTWKAGAPNDSGLWCPGEMGSGKSTIASLLIDHLRDDPEEAETGVAFYYFSYAKSHEQSITNVIKTLIRQLLENPKVHIPQSLLELRARHGNGTQRELEMVLEESAREFKQVYFLFDGVDEINSQETLKPFMLFFQNLVQHRHNRVLVLGRPHLQAIDAVLECYPKMAIRATSSDLENYIASRLKAADSAHLFDEVLSAEIISHLVESSEGLFLLPTIQLNSILQEPTRGDIEDALQNLPHSLFGALRVEMARVLDQSPSRRSLALTTLMWLCMAREPLTADQLADILSLDASRRRGLSDRYRPPSRIIVECCRGLIRYNKGTGTHQLTHIAVREYLLGHQNEYFDDSMEDLAAKLCFLYILDPVFDSGPEFANVIKPGETTLSEEVLSLEISKKYLAGSTIEKDNERQEVLNFVETHSFFIYFCQNWGWHVQNGAPESEVTKLITRFLESQPRIARVYQVDHFISGYRYRYWNPQEAWTVNAAILASNFGLQDIVCDLIDSGKEQVDYATSVNGTTALIHAASSNCVELVRELLVRNADPLRSNWYGNALHCAAEANDVLAIRELLAFVGDGDVGDPPCRYVDAESPLGRTALSCTVDNDCHDAAELLLMHNATMYYPAIRPLASLLERIKLNEHLRDLQCPFIVEVMHNGAARTLTMLINNLFVKSNEIASARKVVHIMREKGLISGSEALRLSKTLIKSDQDLDISEGAQASD